MFEWLFVSFLLLNVYDDDDDDDDDDDRLNNKKLSYRKESVRLLHNIEIRILH